MTEAANTTESPSEVKEAKILAPKARHIDVPLDWPLEFDGQVYDSIRIRRVTGREVEDFLKLVGSLGPDDPMPPVPMLDCPIEVYNALDDDDRYRIEAEMRPFLPLRLREAAELTLATAST